MSDPKRYYLDDYGVLIEHPQGEYVLHYDYARLKAEVEQLQKLVGLQESIDKAIDTWIESKNAAKEGKQP